MTNKSILILGFATLFAAGLTIASSGFTADAATSSEQVKPTGPRYAETCAHGHNGFDCKSSKYRSDIIELQQNVIELEKRIVDLEKRR